MILYHPYAEDLADHPRLSATWRGLALAETYAPYWTLLNQPCGEDSRYEDGLKQVWGLDDLIVIEQDVEVNWFMLLELAHGDHGICAADYRLEETIALTTRVGEWMQRHEHLADTPILQQAWQAHQHAYQQWRHTSLPSPHSAHRIKTADTASHWRWTTRQDAWADYTGLGCTYFSEEFQRRHAPGWLGGHWSTLDSRISAWLQTLFQTIHLHYPTLRHDHPDTSRIPAWLIQ